MTSTCGNKRRRGSQCQDLILCPLLHVSIHRNPFLSLTRSTTGCPVGVDAEPRSSDWLQVTQEKTWRANGGSRRLVHHGEVMWSGGGLRGELNLSSHRHTGSKETDWRKHQHWFHWFQLVIVLLYEAFFSLSPNLKYEPRFSVNI